jgi:hypothetical protein
MAPAGPTWRPQLSSTCMCSPTLKEGRIVLTSYSKDWIQLPCLISFIHVGVKQENKVPSVCPGQLLPLHVACRYSEGQRM